MKIVKDQNRKLQARVAAQEKFLFLISSAPESQASSLLRQLRSIGRRFPTLDDQRPRISEFINRVECELNPALAPSARQDLIREPDQTRSFDQLTKLATSELHMELPSCCDGSLAPTTALCQLGPQGDFEAQYICKQGIEQLYSMQNSGEGHDLLFSWSNTETFQGANLSGWPSTGTMCLEGSGMGFRSKFHFHA